MSNEWNQKPETEMVYQNQNQGHLDDQGTDWLWRAIDHTLEHNGDTLLTGPVVDQGRVAWLAKKST